MLEVNEGNYDATLQMLSKKQSKETEDQVPAQKWVKKNLQALGYEETNTKLVEMGFNKIYLNLKVLQKFSGNCEKSIAFLVKIEKSDKKHQKHCEKHQQKRKFVLELIE